MASRVINWFFAKCSTYSALWEKFWKGLESKEGLTGQNWNNTAGGKSGTVHKSGDFLPRQNDGL